MEQPDCLRHFGLRRAPFDAEPNAAPDAAMFHAQGARQELLGALAYAVTHGDGIIKVTGEAGSGLTLLCHALASRLAGQAVIIHMEPGSVGPLGVIHAAALALGLDPDGQRSDEVLRHLHGRLAALRAGGRRAVLMADHADRLPAQALEEIRLLTNLTGADSANGEHGALLQVVLLGQPALNTSLRHHALRQFRERIALSFVMPPLAADEVPALLAHRLQAAGYAGLELFPPAAARALAAQSKGDLRRLVRLAHDTLAAAASEGAVAALPRHVQAAIGGRLPAWRRPGGGRVLAAGAVAALVAAGAGAVLWLQPAQRGAARAPALSGVVKPPPVQNAARGPTPTAVAVAPHPEASQAISPAGSPAGSLAVSPAASLAVSRPVAQPAVPSAGAATALPAVQAAAVAAPPAKAAPSPTDRIDGYAAAAVTAQPAVLAAASAPAQLLPTAAAGTVNTSNTANTANAAEAGNSPRRGADGTGGGLLQQVLHAGKTWLRNEHDSRYSIKIEDFPAREQARAEAFLAQVRDVVGLDAVHAYPTLNKGEHRIGIAYGSYATEQQARQAMAAVAGRWAYAPKVRNVGAIRAAAARATRAQPRAQQ